MTLYYRGAPFPVSRRPLYGSAYNFGFSAKDKRVSTWFFGFGDSCVELSSIAFCTTNGGGYRTFQLRHRRSMLEFSEAILLTEPADLTYREPSHSH